MASMAESHHQATYTAYRGASVSFFLTSHSELTHRHFCNTQTSNPLIIQHRDFYENQRRAHRQPSALSKPTRYLTFSINIMDDNSHIPELFDFSDI